MGIYRGGIIDKTKMCEAVGNFGMKYAIWVKYPLSFFIIISVTNVAYLFQKIKRKFS